jgi:hypothetical protein
MSAGMSKDRILIIAAIVCGLVWVGDISSNVSTETLVQYIGTIAATFAGVVLAAYFGVRQFYSQARENDRARSQQLAESLAGELFAVLDILAGPPNLHVLDPTGGPNQTPVIFAQLEPTATEEAIRVGLLGSQSSSNLYQLSNLMRDYSKNSEALTALARGPIWSPWVWQQSHALAAELMRERKNLVIWCVTVLYGLAAQGVEMPRDPRYRTDPSIRWGGQAATVPIESRSKCNALEVRFSATVGEETLA